MEKNYIMREVFPSAEGDESIRSGVVRRMVINREDRTARIEAVFRHVIPKGWLDRYSEDIGRAYKLTQVAIEPVFDIPEPTEADILGVAEQLTAGLRATNPLWGAILCDSAAALRGDTLYVTLRHGNKDLLEKDRANEYLSSRLQKRLGVKLSVAFLEKEMEVEHKLEPIYDKAPEPKSPESSDGRVIFGKDFDPEGELMSICDIDNDVQFAVIRGDIFGKADDKGKTPGAELRELKKVDKYLLTFYITDYTGSITVKAFVPKKQAEAVYERLEKPYVCVSVRGRVEYDTYSRELTITARDIIVDKMPEIMDTAEVKRVELHAHSKSSAMDSVMGPQGRCPHRPRRGSVLPGNLSRQARGHEGYLRLRGLPYT